MLSIFNVSSLEFLDNISDKDLLRFSPTRNLRKNYADYELIKRIFTEDITVNPEPEPPPVYPEIIQTLIDSNCQTADDINQIIKSYPYEINSAIFDYKYLNWIKLGSGTITRTNEKYYFDQAGVRIANIFPLTAAKISIIIDVYTEDTANIQPIFFLYTSTNGEDTLTPHFALSYNPETFRYIIQRRSTNNGTIVNGTEYSYTLMNHKKLEFIKNTDGTVQLYSLDSNPKKLISEMSSSSTFKPRSIRINFGKGYGVETTSQTLTINQFQISVNDTVVSKWNKELIYP